MAYKILSAYDASYNAKVGSSNEDGSVSIPDYSYQTIAFTVNKLLPAGTYYLVTWAIPPSSDAFTTSIYFTSSTSVSVPVSISYAATTQYKITFNASTGSSISASIYSSPYGRSGSLAHNATVYAGEVITVNYSVSAGYVLDTATINGSSFTSGARYTIAGNTSVAVSADRAISEISASNGTFGTQQTISITRYGTAYTHTIKAVCGTNSETIVSGSTATSINWTPQASWMTSFPNATSASCTLTVETYSGATKLGSNSVTITLSMPTSGANSILPTPSISVYDAMGYRDTFGGYIAGKSKYAVTVTDGLKFGANISTRSTTANGATYTAASFTTNPISASATSISTTVKDSRGKTATATASTTILAYDNPSVTAFSVHRCTSGGVPDDNGDHFYASWGVKVSPLNNLNDKDLEMKYREVGTSVWTSVPITLTAYTQSGTTSPEAVTADSSYEVQLALTDAFGTVTITTQLSTVAAVMDILNSGNGIAFGKVAETDNLLDSQWDIRTHGDLTVDGGGNITKAEVNASLDIDAEYDSTFFHTNNTSAGSFPSGASSRHGAGITLPYRNAHGNANPDFAGQIWIPNGDMANGANEMFFRASVANSWNAWQKVCRANDFAYRGLTGSVVAIYGQYVHVISTSLPADYSYLVLATVDTNIDYDRPYAVQLTGCDYTRVVRPNSQYGGGGVIYGFVTPKSSATTVTVDYHATYNTTQTARATMLVLRLPNMSTF